MLNEGLYRVLELTLGNFLINHKHIAWSDKKWVLIKSPSFLLKIATEWGTIAPIMSANIENGKLSGTLFGKTRRAVLSLLYGHPDESFYLRQLARLAGVGMGSIQRELRQLAEAGIIRRFHIGRQVFFQSNPDCPVYSELKSLVVKTIGAGDVIRGALLPLAGKIRLAFIFGSMARGRGRRDSDIDVMIVGQVDFAQVVEALSPAQDTLAREINPTVYPQAEFIAKAKKGNHFLMSVLDSEKFFLIGDSNELTKLVE